MMPIAPQSRGETMRFWGLRAILTLAVGLSLAAPGRAQDSSGGQACLARNASLDERIAACSEAIAGGRESGRNLAMAYCNRGYALTEKRELDRALADLEEAIKVDPTYACAYSNRGRVFTLRGDFDRAIQDYDEAIRRDPGFPIAYNNRGDAYLHKGDLDKAIADFTE